jgi:hypothetical protein
MKAESFSDKAREILPRRHSPWEAEIEHFKACCARFAEDVIRRDTKKLYAKEAFFKDGSKEVKWAREQF